MDVFFLGWFSFLNEWESVLLLGVVVIVVGVFLGGVVLVGVDFLELLLL